VTAPDDFFRFPHTPHLEWLGAGTPRGDKVLGPDEAQRLLQDELRVEEKVDGANLGLSFGAAGVLRAQNRGAWIEPGGAGQFGPLRRWLDEHRPTLEDVLARDLILFGEWCFAVHSVEYTLLPDWFLAFDVFDRRDQRFWSADRRDELCAAAGLATVPYLDRGRFTARQLREMLGPSKLGAPMAEGIYLRAEESGRLALRAKIVSPRFTQAIGQHWSARTLKRNRLGGADRKEI